MDAFLGLDPSNRDKLKRSQDQKKSKDETEKKVIKLWIEKYRPKSLDEIVFQDNVVNALKKTKETGKMQHLLFYGPPGTGKTSAILAVRKIKFLIKNIFLIYIYIQLARELYGGEYRKRVLELNASDDRGIQAIRDKVKSFAQKIVTKLESKSAADFQIIILDEADLLTNDAQSALRRIIEDNSQQTRFCIICNYVSKIIDPIVSRCAKFRFNALSEESQIKHLLDIATQENMNINTNIINKIQKVSQGDLRKSINLLQTLSKINPSLLNEDLIDEICGIIPQEVIVNFIKECNTKDTKKLKKLVDEFIESGHSIKALVNQLGNYINSEKCNLDENKKFKLIYILGDIEKDLIQGATPDISCLLLASKISDIITKK